MTTDTLCQTHAIPGTEPENIGPPAPPCSPTPPSGTFAWKKINKVEALRLLTEYNQSNRPQRPADLKRYTNLMDTIQWNWNNPDCICISPPDKDGKKKLLNGQHRLTAFFESIVEEAWFPFIEDIEESIYDTMDQGISRSASDFLNAYGKVKAADVSPDGTTALSRHNQYLVTVVNCMARHSHNMTGSGETRADQARLAQRYERIISPILSLIHVKSGRRGNDAYATPVVSAFANAAVRYGLDNLLPLVRRYATETWADQSGKEDPLKPLHQLIRSYNAKDKATKKKLNNQMAMYSYAVASIRTALSKPEHWTERLLPTKTAADFGDNPQWETRIRQSITIKPEIIV